MKKISEKSPFITVSEAAEILALSKMTVYRMVRGDVLPARRFGRSYRIPRDEFNKFLAAGYEFP